MRVDEFETTYQDYRDAVEGAFNLLDDGVWDARMVTNFITAEADDEMVGTCLAMWMIAIGRREIELDILEERVHSQLCYHIPEYQHGAYDEELLPEEKPLIEEDIEYILQHIELYEVEEIPDEEYEQLRREGKL